MYLGMAMRLAYVLRCNVLDLYLGKHAWRGGVSAGVVGLKNIRKARKLTQKDLARLSGLKQPAISRFETNGRPVSQMYLRTVLRCRRHYNATLWIFSRKDTDMGLKELRLKRGMTQKQLADKIDVTQQHVAAYENGVNSVENMTLDKAIRICDALHVKNPRKLSE